MSFSNIDRRKFIKSSVFLISAPLLFSTISCLGSSAPPQIESSNNLNTLLSKGKNFRVNSDLLKIGGEKCFTVPSEVVLQANSKLKKFCVLRQVNKEGILYLQTVVIEVISIENDRYVISGINNNDVLYINPKLFIQELASVEKSILRKRFLPLEENKGE